MTEQRLNGHLSPEDEAKFRDLAERYNAAGKQLNESLHLFNKTVWAHAEQCGVDKAKSAYDDVATELRAFCRDHRVLTIGGLPYSPEECELSDARMEWDNEWDNEWGIVEALDETVCIEDGETIEEFRGEKGGGSVSAPETRPTKPTREEVLAKLREYETRNDTEDAHIDTDLLLIAYIDDPEIEEAFHSIGKWYA